MVNGQMIDALSSGFAVWIAKENTLKAPVTNVYATTKFTSRSFSQFESIYESYEALCKDDRIE